MKKQLDGHFYQLQQKSLGSFTVVDLNEPEPEDEPPPPPVKCVRAPREIRPKPNGALWMEDILRVVCEVYGFSRLEMKSIRRDRRLAAARQVFFWLAKKHTAHSYPLIGSWCGRDHTTVIHGVRKIDHRFTDFAPEINKCLSRLGVSPAQQEAA